MVTESEFEPRTIAELRARMSPKIISDELCVKVTTEAISRVSPFVIPENLRNGTAERI